MLPLGELVSVQERYFAFTRSTEHIFLGANLCHRNIRFHPFILEHHNSFNLTGKANGKIRRKYQMN